MTANTGLYGSVIKDVFDLFIKDQSSGNADLVVVGRLGRNWIQALKFKKPFKYFDLQDGTDAIDTGIKKIFDYISPYADVSVYHGFFKNIVEYPAKITKITQKLEPQSEEGQAISFIFEPSIEEVLERFEKQLVYSFFDQSIYESALAKFGSRMISLDSATQNISKTLSNTQLLSIKMKHKKQNRRQLELISSINLWQQTT